MHLWFVLYSCMQHIKLMICILQSICDRRRWTHLFLEAQPVQPLLILVVWFLQHSPAVPMSQCHVLLNSYTCCRCFWANLSSEHPDDMDLAEQRIECNSSLFTTLVGCVDRIEAQLGMCTRWFRGHHVVMEEQTIYIMLIIKKHTFSFASG